MRITKGVSTVGGIALCLGSMAVVSGCASSPKARIIRLESGKTEVVASAEKESEAAVAAVDRATEYCDSKKQEAVFASEDPEKMCATDSRGALGFLKKLPVVKKLMDDDEPKEQRVSMSFSCRAPQG